MPWPTNPSEEYFGRGLWGWVTTAWVKLLATAGGALHVYVKGGDSAILVKQQQAALFTPGIHGYDGAAWRKLGLLWGYENVYGEAIYSANVAAGDHVDNFSVVPAGEVWVITQIAAYSAQANVTRIELICTVGGVAINFYRGPAAGVLLSVNWNGWAAMKAGDKVQVVFRGCALNDDLWAQASGYKMAVA